MVETLFLACFAFGALFTIASVALGFVGGGHGGHGHDLGHGTHDLAHGGHASHGDHVTAHPGEYRGLPLLNFSSIVAFLTWFGAAGYSATRFAGWPLLVALLVAVLAGVVGWYVLAIFLRQVMVGERVMDPLDYRLEGTIGQVSVSIPSGGTGEVVFSLAGARRSEAARALPGTAIPRGTEVVITDYARGFATVQPWAEYLAQRPVERTRKEA
jgi:hypothetical protein